jgi:transcription antitermination factor NusA-like protein
MTTFQDIKEELGEVPADIIEWSEARDQAVTSALKRIDRIEEWVDKVEADYDQVTAALTQANIKIQELRTKLLNSERNRRIAINGLLGCREEVDKVFKRFGKEPIEQGG